MPVDELGSVTYTHHYVSLKRLVWLTAAITAAMGLAYFIVGFPPAFDTFREKMYFHSIGIGIAALAVYLVIVVFQLEWHEPPMDLPISYRAFGAVVAAAIGGLISLFPGVDRALPHVGMLAFITAFVLALDVGGALLVELLVLPRKLAGTYRADRHTVVGYFARLVPTTGADLRAYRGRGLGYWLTLFSVTSFFIAELIGFMNLWVMELGPSVFTRYMGWLGLDRTGFLDATLDPHSHMVAIAIMAGIVGVAAVHFRATQGSGARVIWAKIGLWITIAGVIGTAVILGAVAFFNYAPPTLFASAGGVNGMAGDDAVMTFVLLGAMVSSVALMADRAARRDPVRWLFALTWAGVVVVNLLEGFYIEFHETVFQGSGAAKDAAFSTAQPMTGIFLLTAIALGLLLLEYYPIDRRRRNLSAWTYGLGLGAAIFGSTLWTFAQPARYGASFWLYVAGVVVSLLAIGITGWWMRGLEVTTFDRLADEMGGGSLRPEGVPARARAR